MAYLAVLLNILHDLGTCEDWDALWNPNSMQSNGGTITKVKISQDGDNNGYKGKSITVLFGNYGGFKCLLPSRRIKEYYSFLLSGPGKRCSGSPIKSL